jgi:FAD/FMN-containing dehydrogenase
MNSTINHQTVEELRGRFRGELVGPADERYDEARRVWNGMIDKRPALIARCAGADDVVAALGYARAHGLEVAVRGGGHGVAGNALSDGGVVIDLSVLTDVSVDPVARTARVGAGVTLGELDRATQAHGLAAPVGVVTATGVAGLTLAGGMGWLRRAHGLSVDNVLSVELVTADGRILTASDDENAELFWGVRGGGGNFGVVTSFEFRLHPIGPEVMFAFVFYPGDEAHTVLRGIEAYLAGGADAVSPLGVLGNVPHADLFPAETHGTPFVAVLAMYVGDPDEGETALQPLRELATLIVDFSGRMPYVEAQAVLDEDYPDGRLYYWKSVDLDELADDAIERLVARNAAAPSHHSTIDVWFHGGAMGSVAPEATAFGRRSHYLIGVEANWDDAPDTDANVAWARETVDDMRPYSKGGSYLNFPGFFEEGEAQVRASYGDNYDRLVALKTAYDPENVFRLNGNIRPAGTS